MKKIITIIFMLFLVLPILTETNEITQTIESQNITLRAGGGGGSGGGGSSGGGGGTSSHGHNSNSSRNPIYSLITNIVFCIAVFFSSIVFYYKILRSSINNKKYLKLLGKKEISWKYKNIEEQAIEAYYSIQESWTNMDMTPSQKYMSKELYDSFIIKLNFMEVNNKRNVLKKIKIIDIKPVSIYDDTNDDKDFVWLYIKGSMIDYIINTKNNEILEGKTTPTVFVEFWKFTRKGKDKWILTKIKQKEDADTIINHNPQN